MTSSRPYLIRAVHDWITDNRLTPQMLVDAEAKGVVVPSHCVEDGRIVLNVSANAVRGLRIGNDRVEFDARFSGTSFHVELPVHSVLAVVARENGVGMSFPEGRSEPPPEASGRQVARPRDAFVLLAPPRLSRLASNAQGLRSAAGSRHYVESGLREYVPLTQAHWRPRVEKSVKLPGSWIGEVGRRFQSNFTVGGVKPPSPQG